MNEYVLILCLALTVVAVTKVYTGINHIYTLIVTIGYARGKINFSFFFGNLQSKKQRRLLAVKMC